MFQKLNVPEREEVTVENTVNSITGLKYVSWNTKGNTNFIKKKSCESQMIRRI